MKEVIVDSWTKVPFEGLQINTFNSAKDAFEYARNEYMPYGYNIAYYIEDIKTLFLTHTD
jgi:hypothetical protein